MSHISTVSPPMVWVLFHPFILTYRACLWYPSNVRQTGIPILALKYQSKFSCPELYLCYVIVSTFCGSYIHTVTFSKLISYYKQVYMLIRMRLPNVSCQTDIAVINHKLSSDRYCKQILCNTYVMKWKDNCTIHTVITLFSD